MLHIIARRRAGYVQLASAFVRVQGRSTSTVE